MAEHFLFGKCLIQHQFNWCWWTWKPTNHLILLLWSLLLLLLLLLLVRLQVVSVFCEITKKPLHTSAHIDSVFIDDGWNICKHADILHPICCCGLFVYTFRNTSNNYKHVYMTRALHRKLNRIAFRSVYYFGLCFLSIHRIDWILWVFRSNFALYSWYTENALKFSNKWK